MLFYQTGAVSVYKMVNNETWDTGLVTCRDITLMCVRRHGTARQGDKERGRHVCVRSLDSWTASDNIICPFVFVIGALGTHGRHGTYIVHHYF